MTYTSPTWVDVPPGTAPPAGAPALDAYHLQALTDAVAALAAAVGGSTLTPTTAKTANYTAAASDLIPVDLTSASVTVTLPTVPADKAQVLAYIKAFGAGHTLTVSRGGSSDQIETAAGIANTATRFLGAGESIWLQYDAANHLWRQLADRIPLSLLDARYGLKAVDNGDGTVTLS